MALMAARTS